MAYVDDLEEEKKKSGGASEAQTSSDFSSGGGGSGGQSSSSVNPGQQQANTGSASGTGFINFQKYVDANKGKDEQMASSIVGSTAESKDKLDQDIGSYSQSMQTKINQGSTKANLGMLDNPNAIDRDEFGREWNQSYGGPREDQVGDDEDSQSIMNALTQLEQTAANTGSFGGKQALLRKQLDGRDYSAGENRFDAAILGNAQDKLNEVKTLADTAKTGWDQNLGSLRTAAENAKNTSDAERDAFRVEFGKKFGDIEGQIKNKTDELSKENENRKAEYDAVLSQYLNGEVQLPGFEGSGLGYSPLVNYEGDLVLGDIVDDDLRAQYLALQGLSDITGRRGVYGNLDKSGYSLDDFLQVNEPLAKSYTQYGDMIKGLRDRLDVAKSAGDDEVVAQALGVTPADVREARSLGIDLKKYLATADLQDVATRSQMGQIRDLAASIGLKEPEFKSGANVDAFLDDLARAKVSERARLTSPDNIILSNDGLSPGINRLLAGPAPFKTSTDAQRQQAISNVRAQEEALRQLEANKASQHQIDLQRYKLWEAHQLLSKFA